MIPIVYRDIDSFSELRLSAGQLLILIDSRLRFI